MALAANLTREAWIQIELETRLRNRLAQALPGLDDDAPIRPGERHGPLAPADRAGERD